MLMLEKVHSWVIFFIFLEMSQKSLCINILFTQPLLVIELRKLSVVNKIIYYDLQYCVLSHPAPPTLPPQKKIIAFPEFGVSLRHALSVVFLSEKVGKVVKAVTYKIDDNFKVGNYIENRCKNFPIMAYQIGACS